MMTYDRDKVRKIDQELEQDAMANNRFRGMEPSQDLIHVYQMPSGDWAAVVGGIVSDGFSSELHAWKRAAYRAAFDACQMNELLAKHLSGIDYRYGKGNVKVDWSDSD